MGLGVMGESWQNNDDRLVAPLGVCTVCGAPEPPEGLGWPIVADGTDGMPISACACPACMPIALDRKARGVRIDGMRWGVEAQKWMRDPRAARVPRSR